MSNTRLPRAADWMVNGGFDYELPVGANKTFRFGSSLQYSSFYTTTLGERPDVRQPAFAKWNANLAVTGNDGSWEVAIIGNNLTNKYTTGNCTLFDAAGGNVLAVSAPGLAFSPIGTAEAACITDVGRQVFLKVTLRPLASRR